MMGDFQNVMQVFALLDKSNCRRCGEKTCLAFAAGVFRGDKELSACPLLSETVVTLHSNGGGRQST
ncbi:MAG: (Fe-S)-binding protein, partial [Desulfocapsaceae bacterium]|nr:(Fe-S)-binding protein [Desulfocapsaceae bacterium]